MLFRKITGLAVALLLSFGLLLSGPAMAIAADIIVPSPNTSKGVIRLADTGSTDAASGLPIVSYEASPALIGFTENVAGLGISASYVSTWRTPPLWANYFQCRAYADQTGTIQVEQTDDAGTQFYNASATAAITGSGNPAAFIRVSITGANATTRYRCREVNSTTAQTINRLTSGFSAN